MRLFRSVRLFRLFKMFKTGDLIVLMNSIKMTIKSLGNFCVLLFLFIYILSILGM